MYVEDISKPLLTEVISHTSVSEGPWRIEVFAMSTAKCIWQSSLYQRIANQRLNGFREGYSS
jgi:hypothetical protein